jgi:hypothetical protein
LERSKGKERSALTHGQCGKRQSYLIDLNKKPVQSRSVVEIWNE